jgi:hypothetical protein
MKSALVTGSDGGMGYSPIMACPSTEAAMFFY